MPCNKITCSAADKEDISEREKRAAAQSLRTVKTRKDADHGDCIPSTPPQSGNEGNSLKAPAYQGMVKSFTETDFSTAPIQFASTMTTLAFWIHSTGKT